MGTVQKIKTCLWFDDQAEPALRLYASLFEGGQIEDLTRYGPNAPQPEGTVMTLTARFGGQTVIGLNGGPHFTHSPAFSFSVTCDDQAEVDRLWAALLADGGSESQCGWLTDRFGISWQIIPQQFYTLMSRPDAYVRSRVFKAMLSMVKLDVAALVAAAD